ncbi:MULTISPECIES: EVE domain-containing protein [Idiomarinaceae]|uniref:EVE domain-containing protein n=1 Tax=Pseudidiomarina sp. PP-1MA TaxID=3237706 RepID=A0AB39X6E7_9GAMM|nr:MULTISPECIES: EVE domain-containing protein [Idiomarina]MRJ42668.1 EVE domain-containing protein [Idiomarina sp. FeN1]NCU57912.1 EVE domain-containing protein [Idiomarina sp. FenA--70]NCU60464.1 EVE domain-containing protein [Idiomarina sp. FenBw--71]UUN13556.1 EVE domain-containing protein [Idiomarina loihiensis]
MQYWLMKTEPDECSIDDFAKTPAAVIRWDGVRNYQARNFMQDMHIGDEVFIYHSSCAKIGVAGLVRVVRAAYPDPTQFDSASTYFDSKSQPDKPRWVAVDLQYIRRFTEVIPLAAIKTMPAFTDHPLVAKGNRLSVVPISSEQREALNQRANRHKEDDV